MQLRKFIVVSILLLQVQVLWAKDYLASYFGIHSDGMVLNTRSIQFAIDYIHKNGGGRLVFHVGRYLTGTIHLRSNVTLQLEEGAVLVGSLNPFDYESRTNPFWTALVFADSVENIAITGKGMIDGQGKYVARNYVDLIDKGLIKDKFRNGRPEAETRPMNIYFRNCKNITIKNIILKNSASWNQTYDQCANLLIDSIYVDNKDFWNEDGIDIVDCENVTVTNSYIDAADDGICLKSHDPKVACNNILIRNNTVRTSANGIKFGTVSRGGFKNVRIINNKVFDTYRSAIALEAVDGGYVEHIEVDSLQVYKTGNVIFLRVGERWGDKTARMNDVVIRNVYAEVPATKPDAGYSYEGPVEDLPRNISPGIIITGLANKKITGVRISNVVMKHPGGGNPQYAQVSLTQLDNVPEIPAQYPDFSMFKELPAWGIYVRHAKDLQFSNIAMTCEKTDYRLPVVLDDVQQATFNGVTFNQPGQKQLLYQYKSTGIVTR
ncbi:glycoside hydrolase family 28 protein [Flavisolibacter nicotianae]|uniref:glycoside hydrolase family 28 protein n=1 Tax=Flavisolibacter nicotianae TaxID=2364882 RepID=UPI0019698E0F|nr:glycosyl hydrolase family 28 protein [Flavisolibacter nicotianae]